MNGAADDAPLLPAHRILLRPLARANRFNEALQVRQSRGVLPGDHGMFQRVR
jgi:hypothetical protein